MGGCVLFMFSVGDTSRYVKCSLNHVFIVVAKRGSEKSSGVCLCGNTLKASRPI